MHPYSKFYIDQFFYNFEHRMNKELSTMTSQIPSISLTARMPVSTVIMNFENLLLLNGLADFAQVFKVGSSDFSSLTDGKRILVVCSPLTTNIPLLV